MGKTSVWSYLGGVFCAMVLMGCFLFQVGFCSLERDYISWEDLEVDDDQKIRLGLAARNDLINGSSRLIVVDYSGKSGHSLTVQGAIDLVPEYNTQRVKIYILPGIYRY